MKKYYKLVRARNFWSDNYVENKSKDDRKTLSVKKYLNKIRPYWKDINNLKISDTWKIQLTLTINFISSKDGNDEDHVMHWKSDNIEFMINDKEDDVDDELFVSLVNRYQDNFSRFNKS